MPDQQEITSALSHVLWIAGSPCCGKSTISHAIAQMYVFLDYHLDAWASNHFARRIAAGDAEASTFLKMSDEGSDPERRRRNIIARDCQLARYMRQQAEELHLPIYEIDGSRSREEMTELVERHFDPYLIECFKRRK